jgi:hypothetical protein
MEGAGGQRLQGLSPEGLRSGGESSRALVRGDLRAGEEDPDHAAPLHPGLVGDRSVGLADGVHPGRLDAVFRPKFPVARQEESLSPCPPSTAGSGTERLCMARSRKTRTANAVRPYPEQINQSNLQTRRISHAIDLPTQGRFEQSIANPGRAPQGGAGRRSGGFRGVAPAGRSCPSAFRTWMRHRQTRRLRPSPRARRRPERPS